MKADLKAPGKWLSLAGKREKEQDIIRLYQIQKLLEKAGIQCIYLDVERGLLHFPMHLCPVNSAAFEVQYYISVSMKSQTILIAQCWERPGQVQMLRTMQWYLHRRNREIGGQGICYSMKGDGTICLSCSGLRLSDCNAKNIIAAIWELNAAAKESYATVYALAAGRMTEEIKRLIREEYHDLETEWSAMV